MSDASSPPRPSRGTLLRDLVSFQVKLWVEGFKDVILMPLSLLAATVDLLFGGRTLYRLMRCGVRFERWVDLYGALGRRADAAAEERQKAFVDPRISAHEEDARVEGAKVEQGS